VSDPFDAVDVLPFLKWLASFPGRCYGSRIPDEHIVAAEVCAARGYTDHQGALMALRVSGSGVALLRLMEAKRAEPASAPVPSVPAAVPVRPCAEGAGPTSALPATEPPCYDGDAALSPANPFRELDDLLTAALRAANDALARFQSGESRSDIARERGSGRDARWLQYQRVLSEAIRAAEAAGLPFPEVRAVLDAAEVCLRHLEEWRPRGELGGASDALAERTAGYRPIIQRLWEMRDRLDGRRQAGSAVAQALARPAPVRVSLTPDDARCPGVRGSIDAAGPLATNRLGFPVPPCPGCGSPPAATDVDDVCPRCGGYFFHCGLARHVPLPQGPDILKEPIYQQMQPPIWDRVPPSQVRKVDTPETSQVANRPPKLPPDEAIKAYRLKWILGAPTQTEIAEQLSRELGKPVSQGQVSRWLKQAEAYAHAGGVLPGLMDLPSKTPIPVDPERLDLGPRQDGLVERQRKRRSEDA
jgi:hypothetical protein